MPSATAAAEHLEADTVARARSRSDTATDGFCLKTSSAFSIFTRPADASFDRIDVFPQLVSVEREASFESQRVPGAQAHRQEPETLSCLDEPAQIATASAASRKSRLRPHPCNRCGQW